MMQDTAEGVIDLIARRLYLRRRLFFRDIRDAGRVVEHCFNEVMHLPALHEPEMGEKVYACNVFGMGLWLKPNDYKWDERYNYMLEIVGPPPKDVLEDAKTLDAVAYVVLRMMAQAGFKMAYEDDDKELQEYDLAMEKVF